MTSLPAYSCGFPPSRDVVEHARRAADLGYERIWIFDSPALYGDVWVALARIAEAVPDIKLATGVAIPSMRHPVVTASAIATIEELAPGRLWACFGTGYTARNCMGKKGLAWAKVAGYLKQVRGLLNGDVVQVEGEACQLIYSPGFGPERPIAAQLGLAPIGPKGTAVSRELKDAGVIDGVILTGLAEGDQSTWGMAAVLTNGTVLDPGEDATSPRVHEAVGPHYVAGYHAMWEWAPAALATMPGGTEWLTGIEQERPEGQRYLAVHEGHFCHVSDRDRPLLAQAGEAILGTGWTGDPASVAAHVRQAGEQGVSEIVYCPAGPDLGRELAAFASAAGDRVAV